MQIKCDIQIKRCDGKYEVKENLFIKMHNKKIKNINSKKYLA